MHKRRQALRGTEERNALVVANLGLVGFVMRRLRLKADEHDDAFQAGSIGLMRAADLWDEHRTTKFTTFAVHWIWQALLRHLPTRDTIWVPDHIRREVRAEDAGQKSSYHRPERLTEARRAMRPARELIEALAMIDHRVPSIGEENENLARAQRAMRLLPKRYQQILGMRFSGMTLEEVANRFRRSRERIRQIQFRAIARLKQILKVENEANPDSSCICGKKRQNNSRKDSLPAQGGPATGRRLPDRRTPCRTV